MFVKPTVFILGAGASWHYGYPTGEDLVRMVIEKAREARRFFKESSGNQNIHMPIYVKTFLPEQPSSENTKDAWLKAMDECDRLCFGLEQVHPLVVDYFLGQNQSLKSIGKLMIAWIILECEAEYFNARCNQNRKRLLRNSPNPESYRQAESFDPTKCKDNWYRFILHELVSNCPNYKHINVNDVKFVTFNYDVSLESYLYNGLNNIEVFRNEEAITKLLSDDNVIHIYGRVCPTYHKGGRGYQQLRKSHLIPGLIDSFNVGEEITVSIEDKSNCLFDLLAVSGLSSRDCELVEMAAADVINKKLSQQRKGKWHFAEASAANMGAILEGRSGVNLQVLEPDAIHTNCTHQWVQKFSDESLSAAEQVIKLLLQDGQEAIHNPLFMQNLHAIKRLESSNTGILIPNFAT